MDSGEAFALVGIVGFFLAIGAQIWLIMKITRAKPILGFVAILVPLFTWYFAFKNWDVAKRAILIQILGIVAVCVAVPFAR